MTMKKGTKLVIEKFLRDTVTPTLPCGLCATKSGDSEIIATVNIPIWRTISPAFIPTNTISCYKTQNSLLANGSFYFNPLSVI